MRYEMDPFNISLITVENEDGTKTEPRWYCELRVKEEPQMESEEELNTLEEVKESLKTEVQYFDTCPSIKEFTTDGLYSEMNSKVETELHLAPLSSEMVNSKIILKDNSESGLESAYVKKDQKLSCHIKCEAESGNAMPRAVGEGIQRKTCPIGIHRLWWWDELEKDLTQLGVAGDWRREALDRPRLRQLVKAAFGGRIIETLDLDSTETSDENKETYTEPEFEISGVWHAMAGFGKERRSLPFLTSSSLCAIAHKDLTLVVYGNMNLNLDIFAQFPVVEAPQTPVTGRRGNKKGEMYLHQYASGKRNVSSYYLHLGHDPWKMKEETGLSTHTTGIRTPNPSGIRGLALNYLRTISTKGRLTSDGQTLPLHFPPLTAGHEHWNSFPLSPPRARVVHPSSLGVMNQALTSTHQGVVALNRQELIVTHTYTHSHIRPACKVPLTSLNLVQLMKNDIQHQGAC
uniref:(California timema) hypothetical protein n=1 Tax=Timema californicum TaxID=61474 RepID=A0A7R9J2Y0_TIMCA|nr:unnamed protein product [Timema californicum]